MFLPHWAALASETSPPLGELSAVPMNFEVPSLNLVGSASGTHTIIPGASVWKGTPAETKCSLSSSHTGIELGSAELSEPASEIDRYSLVARTQVVQIMEGSPAMRYDDLWERVRGGFQLRQVRSDLVAQHQAWYGKRPTYVQTILTRSQPYLFFIVEELEKRGMPTEIALLPFIESEYDARAHSPKRAAGIWQFMSATGRHYGLEQDQWYDGRRDVVAATRAALDYLQVLHHRFSDWELALAAYNWGEGSVQRAIAKNKAHRKPSRYTSLEMPKETRNYLPKLQALKNIINAPQLAGLELQAVANRPYFQTVNMARHMDVIKAARLADIPVEEFRSLNPGYLGPVMIYATARRVLLPIDKAVKFQANIASSDQDLMDWRLYRLKPGETWQKVAARFDTTAYLLRQANGFTGRMIIRPPQMLLVPPTEQERAIKRNEANDRRGVNLFQAQARPAYRDPICQGNCV